MRRFEAEIRTYAGKDQLLTALEHLATYAPGSHWCNHDYERLVQLAATVKKKLEQQKDNGH